MKTLCPMQRRLTPILQRIISPQQSAFLPDRNIHHSLVMLGEMLNQATISGEEFVLLKLDVVKAFDKMEWSFLLEVLERGGFAGTLTRFLRANFASASSAILLNGTPTGKISLARSVRQGCPLSPLLFILAFDVLSTMLQNAADSGTIEGVIFPNTGIHSQHNMFADDTSVVMKAKAANVRELKRILQQFGEVSGLVCAWDQTIASLIPAGPPPIALGPVPWKWENDNEASKLLGIPTAQTLSVPRIEATIITKLEGRIAKVDERHMTLAARIVIANSLLLGCIWFMLTVWAGKPEFLKRIQRTVERFVWKGRSRIRGSITALPKADGGLNIIGVEAQYKALTGKFMLWILMSGPHPLRSILRAHIEGVSWRRWGTRDLSWIVSRCGKVRMAGSAPWQAICKGWDGMKRWLNPSKPANEEECRHLPLWRPQINHLQPTLARCGTAKQKALRECGLHIMADVLNQDGSFISWEVMQRRGAVQACELPFRNLIQNLKARPEVSPPDLAIQFYMEESWSHGLPKVWQFSLPAAQLTEAGIASMPRGAPERSFRREGPHLRPTSLDPPGPELLIHRIIVGSPAQCSTRSYMGPWQGCDPVLHYEWQDGTALTDTSTAQLRRMQVRQLARPHSALTRWETRLDCAAPPDIWFLTWLSFRSAVENTCLWQILYQVLATQKWRLPNRPAWDRESWCSRCSLGLVEDTFHCIWGCPTSRKCWTWGYWVIKLVSRCPQNPLHLRADHVILATALPQAWEVPFQLWHSIRAILCWLIWKDRNAHVFGGASTV